MASEWQRWYQHEIDKWQGSATVQTFSDAAYRAFHNLIMAQFQQDDGKLPNTPAQLAKLSRMGPRWPKVADEVMSEFEVDADGRIYNVTQYKGWQAARERHQAYMNRKKRRTSDFIDNASIGDQSTIDLESLTDSHGIDDTKEKGKKKEKEKRDKNSCTEPSSAPPFATLPLIGGDEFLVSVEQFEAWQKAFPAVDVENHIQRMKVWLHEHPERMKTRKGVGRFAINWLSREQDKPQGGSSYGAQPSFSNRNQQRTNSNVEAARSAAAAIGAEILDFPGGSKTGNGQRRDVEAVFSETQ